MKNFFGFHLDSVGFWASLICAIHCAVLPLMIMLFSWNALRPVNNAFVETGMIAFTLSLAVLSLWTGYAKHHRLDAIYFLTGGVLLVALSRVTNNINAIEIGLATTGATLLACAHFINWKLSAEHQRQHQNK